MVFGNVLWVGICLFANAIIIVELFEISAWNFHGSKIRSEARRSSKIAAVRLRQRERLPATSLSICSSVSLAQYCSALLYCVVLYLLDMDGYPATTRFRPGIALSGITRTRPGITSKCGRIRVTWATPSRKCDGDRKCRLRCCYITTRNQRVTAQPQWVSHVTCYTHGSGNYPDPAG